LLVFVATVWLLGSVYGVLAVPLGLNVAFASILLWKTAAYWLVSTELCASNIKPQVVKTNA
jgi:hypothetical protein